MLVQMYYTYLSDCCFECLYNDLRARYPKSELCYTDTDRIIFLIYAADIYKKMLNELKISSTHLIVIAILGVMRMRNVKLSKINIVKSV